MHITAEMALDGLSRAVSLRGENHIYEWRNGECLYWHSEEDEPGCIVGLALHQLGVSGEVLHRCTGGIASACGDLADAGVSMDPHAVTILELAQVTQDGYATWGTALAVALRVHMALLRAGKGPTADG